MSEINEHQKYPIDKKKYDREYLRVFGWKCPDCNGSGVVGIGGFHKDNVYTQHECLKCSGLGYIEKDKKK